ncbi:HypC/HybG/HupF family hydrogenase formation chaperone [Aquabacterium sp. OR-4]|uniref:HypC/HybG/HupF family hydrogenase formation chaperone n=1 Tax=Aquabacterium sp. OR-4 TaxID=2978127 RepID=UPI0021B30820|nr:HypC/HybG/HupF family hydrogenase formation chaperone [Aquabacterium sp. OR-4]MDT7833618.1 HypC/HybG/HupF family hydrogenase formation chaperone [Aquabacterium sp. OR-4]
MCLALPARVLALLSADEAVVELGGVKKTVSMALTPEATVGDYVIVHVGHAIGLLDALEAERTLALFAEMAAAGDAAAAAAQAQAAAPGGGA